MATLAQLEEWRERLMDAKFSGVLMVTGFQRRVRPVSQPFRNWQPRLPLSTRKFGGWAAFALPPRSPSTPRKVSDMAKNFIQAGIP